MRKSCTKNFRKYGKAPFHIAVIQGDYDPLPSQGVKKPLSAAIKKHFKFVLLKKCGHTPWIEKEARDIFYKTLEEELLNAHGKPIY